MAAAPAQKAHLAARGGKPPGRQPGGGTPRTRAEARLPGPRPPLRSETLKPEMKEFSQWMRAPRQRCPVRSAKNSDADAGRRASSRFGGRWRDLRGRCCRPISRNIPKFRETQANNLRDASLSACRIPNQGESVNVESDDDATFVCT